MTQQSKLNEILQSLNHAQQEAVYHEQGPCVVFAGAGSGKTKVITTRVALLLEKNCRPWQILAVTFTNKATKEMRERIQSLSQVGHLVHVGTFHSSCARWLREFSTELGFTSDFTIYDDKDSLQAIKSILKELKIDNNNIPPRQYLAAISKAKTLGWSPKEAQEQSQEYSDFFPPLGSMVYTKYQSYLANCNAMDFNDLLMNVLILLRRNSEVKEKLQKRYKYILIDEYQDTNATQFALISHLVNHDENLFVVGDDDQSIYSWRGADPHNIINFHKTYPKAKKIQLEQNYRSSGNIVNAATSVILKNMIRAPKKLWTDKDPGEKITYQLEYDSETEAWWVAENILLEQKKYKFKDVAILYRTNAQSRQIEDTLRKKNIPYQIYGSLKFYDRVEIKDIVAYCRLLINNDDDIAFKRIINTPTRGLGKKTVDTIESLAFAKDVSMLTTCKQLIEQNTRERFLPKIKNFIFTLETLSEYLKNYSLDSFFSFLIKTLEYKNHIEKKFPDQAQDKISNIHELGSALSEFYSDNRNANLSDWLKEISLLSDDIQDPEGDGGVHLMTLHAAKGLEFAKVFIIGVEDGLIPHTNSLEHHEDIEEERRLFYVGITRAQKKLCLLSSQRRRILNNWLSYEPSRFLREIPEEIIKDFTNKDNNTKQQSHSDNVDFFTGQTVEHHSYGKGTILAISNNFGIKKAKIKFYDYGIRIVQLSQITKKQKADLSSHIEYDYNESDYD